MTQKLLAKELIWRTLYRRQEWKPAGAFVEGKFQLTRASTLLDKQVVTIDYTTNKVYLETHALRLPKELSSDLITLVHLKLARIIKRYAKSHRT